MNFDFKSLQSFDWAAFKKLADPNAAEDLNKFLESMPQNTGHTMLIIAAVVWMVAGGLGLYTSMQLQELTELRAELEETEALQPSVPRFREKSVAAAEVTSFVKNMKEIYTGLTIQGSGSAISIGARATSSFGQFREAIGYVQNGGSNWRVNVDSLCVGRECERDPLKAVLRINKVSVDKAG